MPCRNHPNVEDGLVHCARCGNTFCPDCYVELGGQAFCAECKVQRLLDLRAGTAPAVGQLRLASIGRRFGALFLDGLILAIPLAVITMVVMFAVLIPRGMMKPGTNDGLFAGAQLILQLVLMGFGFVAGILYYGIQIARSGQTIGKRIIGLKVVSPDGSDVRPGQAWTRAVVQQGFGFLSCLGIINYLTAFGAERTCIHDMAAKTRVVDWP
ncbi:MAG: RDD family protein [Acidobacteriota bacterium]